MAKVSTHGEMEPDAKKLCLEEDAALQISPSGNSLYYFASDYLKNGKSDDSEEDEVLQKLYAKYAKVIEKIKPTSDPSNAYKMLEIADNVLTPEYVLLNNTITSFVRMVGIDDTQDLRIDDVVLLVSDMFSALRQIKSEVNVKYKLNRLVKAAVTLNRQKYKEQLEVGNLKAHLEDLYSLYPEVRSLALHGRWLSCEEQPYRDTALDIVKAIGIENSNDLRIAHAVTLTMDRYVVLKDQICNQNLRKQFVTKIKKTLPSKMERQNGDGVVHTTKLSSICKKPLVVELVLDGDHIKPDHTFQTNILQVETADKKEV